MSPQQTTLNIKNESAISDSGQTTQTERMSPQYLTMVRRLEKKMSQQQTTQKVESESTISENGQTTQT